MKSFSRKMSHPRVSVSKPFSRMCLSSPQRSLKLNFSRPISQQVFRPTSLNRPFVRAVKPMISKRFYNPDHPMGWSTPEVQGNLKERATTVLCVRKNGKVVMMADGQVTSGDHIVKSSVRKLRVMGDGKVIGGFAGSVADALTLADTLENKLEEYRGQLLRACVEMSKMWRVDKFLRRLEATIIVADDKNTLRISGDGNVFEHDDVCAIGSGGLYAYSAALALMRETPLDAEQIARKAMKIAGDICIYTNHETTIQILDSTAPQKEAQDQKKE